MALKLAKTTDGAMQLKIISVKDDAIDWVNSIKSISEVMPEAPSEQAEIIEKKKAEYLESGDASQLVFLPDAKPTLFIFKHPSRVDVSRKMRAMYSTMAMEQRNSKEARDAMSEAFHIAFIGTQEGLEGSVHEAPRQGDPARITDPYMQSLEDSGVFEELANGFYRAMNKKDEKADISKK